MCTYAESYPDRRTICHRSISYHDALLLKLIMLQVYPLAMTCTAWDVKVAQSFNVLYQAGTMTGIAETGYCAPAGPCPRFNMGGVPQKWLQYSM